MREKHIRNFVFLIIMDGLSEGRQIENLIHFAWLGLVGLVGLNNAILLILLDVGCVE